MKNINIVDMHDGQNVSEQEMTNVKGGPAFLKLGDIKGESAAKEHKEWIIVQSMSSPVIR